MDSLLLEMIAARATADPFRVETIPAAVFEETGLRAGKMQKLAESMYLIVPPGVAVNAAGLRETLGRGTEFDFISERGKRE